MAQSTIKSSTKEEAFLNAILSQTRLASEQITTAPGRPGRGTTELQAKTDMSSSFAVALDNTEKPTHLHIEIDFKVSVKIANTEKQLALYEAKHVVQFNVINWSGFDWSNAPNDVMIPYFAMIQHIAMRRADVSFIEMGMRGIVLPTPSFDLASVPAAVAETASPAK